MKRYIQTIIFTTITITSYGQTFYRGLERMCWTNEKGKIECYDAPRKWYHENLVMVDNDSIYIYQVPLQIVGKKKLYSASDGAFYYYYGIIKQADTSKIAFLTSYNCDYCGRLTYNDTVTGFHYPLPVFDSLKFSLKNGKLKLGKVIYDKIKLDSTNYFPAKSYFYLDSNSISRTNPKKQYGLISQGIKNFIQTGELKLDGDTLRICVDRFDDYQEKNLIESLDPNLFKIDTTNIVCKFYTKTQLNNLVPISTEPIRVIKIKKIIDYWKAARISLTYKIFLPKIIYNFSEKEYNNLFEYSKVGQTYELNGELPQNSWTLVEQK